MVKEIKFIKSCDGGKIDETYPRVIDCPKCSGLMIYKITPNKGKELYECQRCNHIIWVR